jgi:hypothetical protein
LSCSDRKVLRQLCDSFFLIHKVVHGKSGVKLQIFKDKLALPVDPPSFDELLSIDNGRESWQKRFDGKPMYWSTTRQWLGSLREDILCVVAHKLAHGMLHYPSADWMLMIGEILQARSIPLPRGFLRATLRQAKNRTDLYGLLEAMQMALKEKELCKSKAYQSKLQAWKYRKMVVLPSDSDPMHYNLHQVVDSASDEAFQFVGDELTIEDWSTACSYAMMLKPKDHLPLFSFKNSFIEVRSYLNFVYFRFVDNIVLKVAGTNAQIRSGA